MHTMKSCIITDDSKVPMFKDELDAAGIDYTVRKFTGDTTSMIVDHPVQRMGELPDVCKKVEKHFRDLSQTGVN